MPNILAPGIAQRAHLWHRRSPLTSRVRITIAVALGLCVGGLSIIVYHSAVPPVSDWDQVYQSVYTLWHGGDPYGVVRNGGFPTNYPLTTYVLSMPLGLLPLTVARAAFVGVGSGVLAYALTTRGLWGLATFGSASWLAAFFMCQWSPFLVGASAFPALAAFNLLLKPTVGLAIAGMQPRARALPWAAAVVALTIALWPWWPLAWLGAIRASDTVMSPVLRPGGFLLLLALLRWRLPEGRLLALLAVVPQTSMLYDTLPLFLIPDSARELLWLTVLSLVGAGLSFTLVHETTLTATIAARWPYLLVSLYLPALFMVLRRQAHANDVARSGADYRQGLTSKSTDLDGNAITRVLVRSAAVWSSVTGRRTTTRATPRP
jgi:hypothetical protein